MRNWKKAMLSLTLVGCLTVGIAGCSNGNDGDGKTIYVEGTEEELVLNYTVVSDKYFIKSGQTDYVIVYPEDCDSVTLTAAQELRGFFQEATGTTPSLYHDGQELPENAKFFSLGNTKYAQANVADGNGGVENQGFRLVTVGDNVYVLGNGSHGVVYGVYELLEYMFHYEFFKEDVYNLDKNVSTLNFFTLDYKEAPDIDYRVGYSALSDYNSGIQAMRYRLRSEWELSVGGIHNSFTVLDPTVYNNPEDPSNYHPKWFATDQLCYTAQGDAAERQKMIDTAAEYFIDDLLANKTKTFVYFQMQDTHTWCGCGACEASKTQYNAESTAMLQVCQGIHEKLTEMLSAEGDTRNVKIVPLLYHATEDVPVVKDESTGEYKMSDPSLNFDGVCPMWANLSRKSHEYAWTHEQNSVALDMLDQMNVAFPEYWIWDYGVDFKDYLIPYNIFNNLGEDFKTLQKYNIGLHLYQCDHTAYNSTAFGALKLYLITQLTWDANQDIATLIDKFFKAAYGDAAPAIKGIYDSYQVLAAYNSVKHGDTPAWNHGVYSTTMVKEEYFPKGTVLEWLSLLDEAYAAIAPLETTDPEAYEKYMFSLDTESIFVRYIYAVLYVPGVDDESLDYKIALYNDINRLNFNAVAEQHNSIWTLAQKLKIDAYL